MDPIKNDVDISDIFKGLNDLAKIYEDVGETLTNDQLEKMLSIIEPLREGIV